MPEFAEYARWYYAIYLVPGGLALFLLLASSLGHGMHHGHHAHAGHAGSGHAHHGTGAGHLRIGHARAGQVRHGAPTASAHKAPFLPTFFGLGRVPVLLVWGSALLGWGIAGFWGTQFWQGLLHFPALFLWPSLATALAGAFVTEKVTVETVARFLPGDETFAVSAVDLCGLTGTAAFPVDTTRGRVHVYDPHGTLYDMSARLASGPGTVARGRRVLVTDYDPVRDQLIVEETRESV